MSAKPAEGIPRNKIFVYIIGHYIICSKGNNKYLTLKYFTMIDPIMGCLKITEYDDKHVITMLDLVETMWLTMYPWPTLNAYGQGK